MASRSHAASPSPLTTSLLEHTTQALGTHAAGLTPAQGCVQHISWSSALPTLPQHHPRKKHQHKPAVQLESLSASRDFLFPRGSLALESQVLSSGAAAQSGHGASGAPCPRIWKRWVRTPACETLSCRALARGDIWGTGCCCQQRSTGLKLALARLWSPRETVQLS